LKPSGPDRTATSEADAAELRSRLLRGLSATDRRLRLRRSLASLTWFAPAACLWLLASWLLELGAAGESTVAALWPSWAGGAVLLLLAVREVAALGRDLPAAARAVDRTGDLHDAVATALEMQQRLDDSRADRRRENDDTVWPLPWIALVLERAVAGLERTSPKQTVPRLVPRGALPSVGVSLLLLLPVALPRSFVGEALASAMTGDAAGDLPPGFEAAALFEDDPNRIPGVPELDVRLSDLPFVTLRVREPNAEGARSGDSTDAAEGGLGDGAEAEALDATAEGSEAAANVLTDETNPETGADLMRELDNREGTGEEEKGAAHGTEGSGEGTEPGAEAGKGDGSGGQPVEDGEGPGDESGSTAAVSDEPGSSHGEADGAAAGVGTGPQEEMVDPFGDLLVPALSLEQALETALLESIEDIERRPLTTTSATQFRAAEVAMRGAAPGVVAEAAASSGDLPAARHPIAWRHRESVRRYLEALEAEAEEDGE